MDLWDVQVQALLNDYFLKTRGGLTGTAANSGCTLGSSCLLVAPPLPVQGRCSGLTIKQFF